MAVDMKLVFLTAFIIAICYETNVNCFSDDFTASACHKFKLRQEELYQFVTIPDMVDKWMDWLPFFISADHKPLGVGKHFKAFFENGALLLRVTEFDAGNYIAMESNYLLRPRIELCFSEEQETSPSSWHSKYSHLKISLSFKRTSVLFQYTIGAMFRAIFQEELQRSLKNLEAILERMSNR